MTYPTRTAAPESLPLHSDPRIGRRTLATGIAWSVPVVMTAGAAPAIAPSRSGITVVSTGIASRVSNGSKVITFTLSLTNLGATDISITSITFQTTADWTDFGKKPLTPLPVPGGSTGTQLTFTATEQDASADTWPLTFVLVDSDGRSYTVTISGGSVETTPSLVTVSQS